MESTEVSLITMRSSSRLTVLAASLVGCSDPPSTAKQPVGTPDSTGPTFFRQAEPEIGYGNTRFGWNEEPSKPIDDCVEKQPSGLDPLDESAEGVIDMFELLTIKHRTTAQFPAAAEVSRVTVRRTGSENMGDPPSPPLVEITDPERIAAILEFLHRHRSDWESVPWTPPSPPIHVSFYDENSDYTAGVSLGGYGSLQGRIAGDDAGHFFKNLSEAEFRKLKVLLGLCPEDR